MRNIRWRATAATVLMAVMLGLAACAAPKPVPVKAGSIPEGEVDPAVWGSVYPLEYESWQATKEPRPTGKSRYKRGFDTDKVVYDKLSEFPFMALLFRGWGFGVEYNEPRGHYYMLIDQGEVDPSRVKAGGACLNCKTPYMDRLVKENGPAFYRMPYEEAVAKIPPKHKDLGVSCVDCHDSATAGLKVNRQSMRDGLRALGGPKLGRQEMRIAVCGQCHCTYSVTKDAAGKSTGVVYPWQGSRWGGVSIEGIIKSLRGSTANLEWKQEVTGLKLPFIRHPDFELFTNQSVHFKAGLACADCHMPYKVVGAAKITDHDVKSPLKADLKACRPCHPQTEEALRAQVLAIQDRTASLVMRSGYQAATVAKLLEMAHEASDAGRKVDQGLLRRAEDSYVEAFLRVVFLGAENSMGFHNPTEVGRVAGDALAFGGKAEALLRQALTEAGVDVPVDIDLELGTYLRDRGTRKLGFKVDQEFKDPFGLQQRFVPEATAAP